MQEIVSGAGRTYKSAGMDPVTDPVTSFSSFNFVNLLLRQKVRMGIELMTSSEDASCRENNRKHVSSRNDSQLKWNTLCP
jgi:hypothetical protein